MPGAAMQPATTGGEGTGVASGAGIGGEGTMGAASVAGVGDEGAGVAAGAGIGPALGMPRIST